MQGRNMKVCMKVDEVISLRDINKKQLCGNYLSMVLTGRKKEGKAYCKSLRKQGTECGYLCSHSAKVMALWNCMVSIKTIENDLKLINQLSSVTTEIQSSIEEKNEIINNLYEFLSGLILDVVNAIVNSINNSKRKDESFVLTVNNITYGKRSSPDFEITREKSILNLISKYYEVSAGWNNGDVDDKISMPLFEEDRNGVQIHYIAKDISRVFGTCTNYENGLCEFGVRCRRSIHLNIEGNENINDYNIDRDLEDFRSILSHAINKIKSNISGEPKNLSNSEPRKLPNFTSEIYPKVPYKNAVTDNTNLKPIITFKKKETKDNFDINYWSNYWLGDNNNMTKLYDALINVNTSYDEKKKLKLQKKLKDLIRRLCWIFAFINQKNQKLDFEFIKEKWVQYNNYLNGIYSTDSTLELGSLATNGKMLDSNIKYVGGDNENKQNTHKKLQKESFRGKIYSATNSEHRVGECVFSFDKISEIDSCYLDKQAEFLGLKMFDDCCFLIPNYPNNNKKREWQYDSETEKDLVPKIKNGVMVMSYFEDREIRAEYVKALKNCNDKKDRFSIELSGGNWIWMMPQDQFDCIRFYFENSSTIDMLSLHTCLRHKMFYGKDLEDLRVTDVLKLYENGIDINVYKSFPPNIIKNIETKSRKEIIDLFIEYNLQYAYIKVFKENNPDVYHSYVNTMLDPKQLLCSYDELRYNLCKETFTKKFIETVHRADKKSMFQIAMNHAEEVINCSEGWFSSIRYDLEKSKKTIEIADLSRIMYSELGISEKVSKSPKGGFGKVFGKESSKGDCCGDDELNDSGLKQLKNNLLEKAKRSVTPVNISTTDSNDGGGIDSNDGGVDSKDGDGDDDDIEGLEDL